MIKRALECPIALNHRVCWSLRRRSAQTQFVLVVLMFLVAFNRDAKGESGSSAERPNVVVILVDDQGYYDLGCYGATEVKTPHIDQLASEGIRFTDYYAAAPICSPSRAGLLTGCYPRRVGNHIWVHRADSQMGIHPDEVTLAELFKNHGYATSCIGKWHLGFKAPLLPGNQGFDHYYGLLHNLDPVEVVYFEESGGVPLVRNHEVIERPADPAKLTRAYTDEAIRFIEKQGDHPFFLYLPHTMLHHPLGVSEPFRGSSDWGEYGDAIQELDHHFGRLMDCLVRNKLDQKTLIIFASDNGRGPGRNATQPIRGRKLTTYEGGIRVPAICWGPGLGVSRGLVNSEVVRAMDWFPTAATMAGIELPEEMVIDGRDLAPMIKGESRVVPAPGLKQSLNGTVPLRRSWDPPYEWDQLIKRHEYNDAFFYHGSEGTLAGVRWKQWKLVLTPSLQLFDLKTDPGESVPVRNGEMLRKLRGMAILFQQEMMRDSRPPGIASPKADSGQTTISTTVLDEIQQELDVTYQTVGDHNLKMDLFRPKRAWGRLPAIVCIHGGGWHRGAKEHHRLVAQQLAHHGFVTCSINYRLSGEAQFPAAIQDCKAAVQFLRDQSDHYGIDGGRIGAIGLSAGGHLAALLGTSAGVKELEAEGAFESSSSAVQAVVAMGAQTDLLSVRVKGISGDEDRGLIWRKFLGGSQTEQMAQYRLASPLSHLDADDPAIWLITGENDDPSTRGVEFRAQLDHLGIQTGLTVIPGAPHGFLGKQVWFDQMISDAVEFFRTTLRADKE